MSENPVQILENAMKPIVDEMFKNGPEEGSRIWADPDHPLHQAIQVLLNAQSTFTEKDAAALIEQHRRMEEGPLSL
jgi:hypothetical protein